MRKNIKLKIKNVAICQFNNKILIQKKSWQLKSS